MSTLVATAAGTLQSPEQFLGFKVGADNKLVRWDKIVEYMKLAAANSDRVRFRELGKTSNNNPFIALEISAPDTLKNLDRYKQLERKLYFQGGAPTDARARRDLPPGQARRCSSPAASTRPRSARRRCRSSSCTASRPSDSPAVKKILDNVIFLLVPSLNPDGQIMVTDWFNKNVGTPYTPRSPMPYLYHPYVGHDNNRDMYMFTQKESQHTAQLLWHDWFPSVWLDEHQMGSNGARIFVMPATDPINPNVHPLIYRWNGILGQSQAAALEAAGKEGIIYNSTYTNFWEGAMAWSGWWHNQIGLLTEVASARVAAPIDQQRAVPGTAPAPAGGRGGRRRRPRSAVRRRPAAAADRHHTAHRVSAALDGRPLDAPRHRRLRADRDDGAARNGGGSARDDPAADLRGQPADDRGRARRAIRRRSSCPVEHQQDAREAAHLVDQLHMGGVEVYRADAAFEADGKDYGAGTFVIPMTQVFARYAKDMLEKQTYPEVRRAPNAPPEPPYDVTAWSLGMLLGVDTVFVKNPLPDVKMTKVDGLPKIAGRRRPAPASRFAFDYKGPDTAIAINRLLKDGAHVVVRRSVARRRERRSREPSSNTLAKDFGLDVKASDRRDRDEPSAEHRIRRSRSDAPRVAHVSAVDRRQHGRRLDALGARAVRVQPDVDPQRRHPRRQAAAEVRRDHPRRSGPARHHRRLRRARRSGPSTAAASARPASSSLKQFVADGGTLVTMGNACDLAIEKLPIPVRNLKKGLTRDQHFAPGAILQHRGRHAAPDRLRRGRRHLRLLHQQPVLLARSKASPRSGRPSSRAIRTRT